MRADKEIQAILRHTGGAQIDPRDDSRVPYPFALGFWKGWVLLRFGERGQTGGGAGTVSDRVREPEG